MSHQNRIFSEVDANTLPTQLESIQTAMEMELSSGDSTSGATWIKRAEIDTRAPFRSVREAVSLFRDGVLDGKIHNGALAEASGHRVGAAGDVIAELEETRQSLQKAREDGRLMESRLSSLNEELERAKQELLRLKTNPDFSFSSPSSSPKHPTADKEEEPDEPEHVRFVGEQTTNRFEARKAGSKCSNPDDMVEFQKKRYVTFVNTPPAAQDIVPERETVLQRHSTQARKKKLPPLIPLIGGIFSKSKKNNTEVHHEFPSPPLEYSIKLTPN